MARATDVVVRVDRDDLLEQVSQLATEHADLTLAVHKLLDRSSRVPGDSDCRQVHLCGEDLALLRRLTGGS